MRENIKLTNPRILVITLLGFSSTLPLSLTGSTLQAWFTQAGLSIAAVGALTLLGMPYLLKFLWAPVMDKVVPPWLGRRRGWILITQIGLVLTLIALANLNPSENLKLMGWVALIIAFISASQDIAIDAYRTDTLLPEERGMGTAYFVVFARLAMIVSGGLSLILADYFGWRVTYEMMAGILSLFILATIFGPDRSSVKPPATFKDAVIDPFKDLLKRNGILLMFIFVATYKIGDALALSLMSNFLIKTLGFSLSEVGIAFKSVGVIATILGALLGGLWLNKLGLFKSLLLFGSLQAFSNLMFMLLAVVGKNTLLMTSSIFIEGFCSGMSTTALVVLLTALCHQEYSATQYAFLSALSALGRVFLGPVAALIVEYVGWTSFYGWSFLLCFPSLILLTLLRNRMAMHAEALA